MPEPREQLYEDLLVGALEGGSNYWYFLPDIKMVPRPRDLDGRKSNPLAIDIYDAVRNGAEVPVADGENGEKLGSITNAGIRGAFGKMEKYADERKKPHIHQMIGRIKSGDSDASDADVWFQFVVMGNLVYG